jgi:hypothetical protein
MFIGSMKVRLKGYLFKLILSDNITMLNWQSFSPCESGLEVCQWAHKIFMQFLLDVR